MEGDDLYNGKMGQGWETFTRFTLLVLSQVQM
jgi:hypothetical protein